MVILQLTLNSLYGLFIYVVGYQIPKSLALVGGSKKDERGHHLEVSQIVVLGAQWQHHASSPVTKADFRAPMHLFP